MKNVKVEVLADTMTITIDLSKSFGRSKSGKSTVIASTEGNVPIPDNAGVLLGLNLFEVKR